jgi:hypothetical protein
MKEKATVRFWDKELWPNLSIPFSGSSCPVLLAAGG